MCISLSLDAYANYKNSNGEELNKSFRELLQWQRNSKDPEISIIDLSDEWKNINLEEADNYFIWIGHSSFLIKKMVLR